MRKTLTTHRRLYVVWASMHRRCYSPENDSYPHYGGRGIRVCNEWHDMEAFFQWSLRSGWKIGLQIDRIDNDGDYEPGNCRWATRVENARKTSRNRMVTALGETKCVSAWAEDSRCVVSRTTLKARLNRGWNPVMAITQESLAARD